MDRVLIVGSGASGVHFALSLLGKGYPVTMLDVGQPGPKALNPDNSFSDLKSKLTDPVEYYLGKAYESVVFPGSNREYHTKPFAFPPDKSYIFSTPAGFSFEANGFEPMFSFAQGGLAEAWTGGVYPFNDAELKDFPFSYADIEPAYSEVARRIGVFGDRDELAQFFPVHENLMEPLRLDENSQQLLANYEKRKDDLSRSLNTYLGRSRVSTLSRDRDGRKACWYCGRCLWGCPAGALYTPLITLNECRRYPNFTYVPNMYVSHFKFDTSRRITGVVAESTADGAAREFSADRFALAAGALSSSKIVLDSIWQASGKVEKLTGLMDNRQILIPFVNLKMVGKRYNPENYQYHQLAIGIKAEKPEEYAHGQITTLKTALLHPILHNAPIDLRTSVSFFRNVRAALGMVNLNLHDARREDNSVSLEPDHKTGRTKLVINYSPRADEKEIINTSVKVVKKVLWKLGCVVPPGMTHVRPMGSSVHYAGTLPMSTTNAPHTSSKYCASHDFNNLYYIDGVTFPFLPAKNITFTLMANAVRVADNAF
jgi:choline dehydrogenase-like flavoprotein